MSGQSVGNVPEEPGDQAMRAGIDIGTNSVRLLLLDARGETLHRRSTVTKLGEGVNASGLLSDAAMNRTVDAIKQAALDMQSFNCAVNPSTLRITATSAARDATNGERFFAAVNEAIGMRPEVLSGADEGALAWAGAMRSFEPRFTTAKSPELDVLIDIGGGSTEFVVGQAGSPPLGVHSLQAGCVRMTEQFLHSDPPSAVELSGLITVMHAHLDDVERELPLVNEATRFVGVAGSIITVAAVELGYYDRDSIHGMWLSRAAAEDVFRTLAQESASDRAFNPGLPQARVGTIVAGAGILVTILRHFDLDGLWVSETDLLDALAASAGETPSA
jgi:exopolyphosphatase / guanosine-5'-triphosphate,3'-diphosphate pyrophosphatase